jgi:hypothetical protein
MTTVTQNCSVCNKLIQKDEQTNEHHPHYISLGGEGTDTQTLHRACHVAVHSKDWRVWGSLGGQITAATKVWSLNLKNVNIHPAHEINRQFYRLYYSH